MTDKTHAEATQKMWDLIKDIGFAMLTTEDEDHLRARPMASAQKEFDGNLWFFTRASAHKVDEVGEDPRVGVTYAEPSKQHYVSLSGRARLVRDKGTIEAHWSEAMRTWFPKDDQVVTDDRRHGCGEAGRRVEHLHVRAHQPAEGLGELAVPSAGCDLPRLQADRVGRRERDERGGERAG